MADQRRRAVPKPVSRGVVRVPVVMQMESLECGAAALVMIMHHYRKWITLAQARVDCCVSMHGASANDLLRAARGYGMVTGAWRVEPESLLAEGPFPCILHWGFNHFVVLCGFHGRKAVINDPARGRIRVEWEDFDRQFTGVCLTFAPGEGFTPSGRRRSVLTYAGEHLRGYGPAVAFLALATAVSSLLGLIQPAFARVFLDRLLTGRNPTWLAPFTALFLLFALVNVAVCWLTSVYSLHIQGVMDARGSGAFLRKVLHLPMSFFDQRLAADIADRQAASAGIARALAETLAPLAIQTLMMVVYLAIMIHYSALLTLIGVGTILLNLLVSLAVTARRVNLERVRQRDSAKLYATTVSGLDMIEVIKASGAENGFFGRWAGYQAGVNARSAVGARLNHMLGAVPGAIAAVSNVAVLGLGVALVLRGRFTAGMVMAFQGFLSAFMAPASSLITAGQSVQEMVSQMERQDDVLSGEEDPAFVSRPRMREGERLSGAIALKHVTFGYSRSEPPVISDFSLTVEPGQRIALVGQTGCGKTTLARLMAGLYHPWSGAITYDGVPIEDIDRGTFARSVSVVDREAILFEDTVEQNIRLWDDAIEDAEVQRAARDVGIHEVIAARDGGYHRTIQAGGREFSGGQRMCLEIARALAVQPGICILDEATAALDVQTEDGIMEAIRRRGITCIIIAHRLSAIRDCDEIIVMAEGRIVERGTHEALLAMGGAYSALVDNG